MSMYEDLDSFLETPSALTVRDIVEDYKEILKRALKGGTYFIDKESNTCCGLLRMEDRLVVFRLEGEGHRFTRGLLKKILHTCRTWQKKTGLPIEVHTKICFYNEKVKKLLKLTQFETKAVQNGYYISIFRG